MEVDTGAHTGEDTGLDTGEGTGLDTVLDTGAGTGLDTEVGTGVDTGVDTGAGTLGKMEEGCEVDLQTEREAEDETVDKMEEWDTGDSNGKLKERGSL